MVRQHLIGWRPCRPLHFQVFLIGVVPDCGGFLRIVLFDFKAAADNFAGFGYGADIAGRNRLHHNISGCRCFDGSGDHAPAAGVCGRLAELAVLRAAADDMDRIEAARGQFFAHCQTLGETSWPGFPKRNAILRLRSRAPAVRWRGKIL